MTCGQGHVVEVQPWHEGGSLWKLHLEDNFSCTDVFSHQFCVSPASCWWFFCFLFKAKVGLSSAISLHQNLQDLLVSIAWAIRGWESYISSVMPGFFLFRSNVIHHKVESYGSTDSRRRISPYPCSSTLSISSASPDIPMKIRNAFLGLFTWTLMFCKSPY